MDGLHDHLARYRVSFLSTDHSHVSVNDMWVSSKSEVLSAIERFIPSKMTKTKYSLPWIDISIKRLIRKRDKLYFRARKSSSPDIKNHYKRFRAHVQKSNKDAYWKKFQGRRRRSGRSGHGRTTFLAEHGLGRTTTFDYSAENVIAFATFLRCGGPILSYQLILSVLGQSAKGCERRPL